MLAGGLLARVKGEGRQQQYHGKRWWRNGFGMNDREQGYLQVKSQSKNEKYGSLSEINAMIR